MRGYHPYLPCWLIRSNGHQWLSNRRWWLCRVISHFTTSGLLLWRTPNPSISGIAKFSLDDQWSNLILDQWLWSFRKFLIASPKPFGLAKFWYLLSTNQCATSRDWITWNVSVLSEWILTLDPIQSSKFFSEGFLLLYLLRFLSYLQD